MLSYAPTTLDVQSCKENIPGATRTKKVEYYCSRGVIRETLVLRMRIPS